MLANSGEDEFEEIFKLLIAKLCDEHARGHARFYAYDSDLRTFEEIALLLQEANRKWPDIIAPCVKSALTPQHLQVCVEALAKHTLFSAGLEVMDVFFEFLISRRAKGAKGQYFTPRHVIEFCVQMLRPQPTETVLDPACGSGGFLIHAFNFARQQAEQDDTASQDYAKTKLWGCDVDAKVVRIAKTLMILAGNEQANLYRLNSLLIPSRQSLLNMDTDRNEPGLTIEDVCRSRLRNHKGFDVILTNPPFAGEIKEPNLLDSYVLAQGKERMERDVLFLERCLQLLKPGGRMAIVLPHNKFAAEAFGPVRRWVLQKGRVLAVVGLGRNTFLPHTHQKASILFIQRRNDRENASKQERVFFAVSERDGKNSKGQWMLRSETSTQTSVWANTDHDLDDIVPAFHAFCEEEELRF